MLLMIIEGVVVGFLAVYGVYQLCMALAWAGEMHEKVQQRHRKGKGVL